MDHLIPVVDAEAKSEETLQVYPSVVAMTLST